MKVLNIVKNVLDEFHKNNINYCHFKSNNEIEKDLNGSSDLDIIIDVVQNKEVENILMKLNFFKAILVSSKKIDLVRDYFYLDTESKTIFHLHAHFRISFDNSFYFPFEKEILNQRVFNKEYNIYVSSIEYDFLLRLIKISIKLKGEQYLDKEKIYFVNKLLKNINKDKLKEIINKSFNKDTVAIIENIISSGLNKNYSELFKLKVALNKQFNTNTNLRLRIYSVFKKSINISLSLNRKFGIIKTLRNHRTFQDEGLIIAIMGSDGSGKSTQVKNIKNILSKKIDVRYVYMGSGNGTASWHRNILIWLQKIFFKKKKNNDFIKEPQVSTDIKKVDFTKKDILKIIYALSLAIEKRTKLKLIQKYKNKGMIVVTDRYPQTSIYGYNDGPLIADYLTSNNKLLSFLSQIEFNSYEYAKFVYPDIVIKLLGNPEIIHSRRADEMSLEQIIKKQNGIKSIDFTDKTKVVDIDATLSIDEVTIQIMAQISNSIGSKNE